MTGFEDFLNKAEAAAKTAAGAARRGAEQAKLSIQIAAEEDKLKTAYAELGKLTYTAISEGTQPDDAALERQMSLIRKYQANIRELRRRKKGYASQKQKASQQTPQNEVFVVVTEE